MTTLPVTPLDIEAAAARLVGHVRETPIMHVPGREVGVPGQLTWKLEQLQHSGSFKARGAFNRILTARVGSAGVIAASGGNHGAAVAYAARALGYTAEIFVPEISNPVKIERLRAYGARVHVTGQSYAEALAASEERAAATGALVVHAYDQPEVIAGQGTAGRELERQAPGLDTVLVAVGGGGFIAGIAAWYAGRVRVVAVEPHACDALSAARRAGEPVDVSVSGVAADSLGARRIGRLAFDIARAYVHGAVLVDDDAIRQAQRVAWDAARLILEPGGATALAALLSGAYTPAAGERVGVLLCGGNTSPATVTSV